MSEIKLPEFSLTLLIGVSGTGKSTFAAKHFQTTEVISSDHCRALVSDDENEQSVNQPAFEILHLVAEKRLQNKKLTVIDATNVETRAREPLLKLAHQHHCPPIAIVFNLPKALCKQRRAKRTDRNFPPEVLAQQYAHLIQSIPQLKQEGFQQIYEFSSTEAIDSAHVQRFHLANQSSQ